MDQTARDRRRPFSLQEQIRLIMPLLFIWSIGFIILAAVAAQGDAGQQVLDPTYSGGAAWHIGFVTSLSVLAWTCATVSSAWCSWVSAQGARTGAARFMKGGAIVSAVFLVDDLFDIHAEAFPAIGLPRAAGALVLLAIAALWAASQLHEARRTRIQVLLAAFGAIAVSVLIEGLLDTADSRTSLLLSNGAKFLGILAWACYFTVTARDITRSVLYQSLVAPHTLAGGSGAQVPVAV